MYGVVVRCAWHEFIPSMGVPACLHTLGSLHHRRVWRREDDLDWYWLLAAWGREPSAGVFKYIDAVYRDINGTLIREHVLSTFYLQVLSLRRSKQCQS